MLTLPASLWTLQPIPSDFFKQREAHGRDKVYDKSWAPCSPEEENDRVVRVLSSLILRLSWSYFYVFLIICFYSLSITQEPSPASVNTKGYCTSDTDDLCMLDPCHMSQNYRVRLQSLDCYKKQLSPREFWNPSTIRSTPSL